MTKKKGSAGGEKFSRGAEDGSRRRYLKKNCCCTKETDLLVVVFTVARALRVSTGIHLPCS